MAIFLDDFDRSNRDLNGDNGWTVADLTTGAGTNGLVLLDTNRARTNSVTQSFVYRSFACNGEIDFSADMFNLTAGWRTQHMICLGASSVSDWGSFINSCISIRPSRSSVYYDNSTLYVYDGATLVTSKAMIFQIDADFSVRFVLNSDGSGTSYIYSGTGLTGTMDSISWSARTWTNGAGAYSGFYLQATNLDGDGNTNTRGIDNFSISVPATSPTVTTQAATAITATDFVGNGTITDTGGANATRRGFCYIEGTTGDPTIDDSIEYEDGSFSAESYTINVGSLTPDTTYSVRAYATNSEGTSYGDTVEVTTSKKVTGSFLSFL